MINLLFVLYYWECQLSWLDSSYKTLFRHVMLPNISISMSSGVWMNERERVYQSRELSKTQNVAMQKKYRVKFCVCERERERERERENKRRSNKKLHKRGLIDCGLNWLNELLSHALHCTVPEPDFSNFLPVTTDKLSIVRGGWWWWWWGQWLELVCFRVFRRWGGMMLFFSGQLLKLTSTMNESRI